MSSQDNAKCKIFYQRLQDTIDDSWKGDGSSIDVKNEPFPSLPGNTNQVCFGNSSQSILKQVDREFFDEVSFYAKRENNLFFYPLDSCGSGNSAFTLSHMKTSGFFCTPVVKGKIGIRIMKGKTEALVTLCDSTAVNCK